MDIVLKAFANANIVQQNGKTLASCFLVPQHGAWVTQDTREKGGCPSGAVSLFCCLEKENDHGGDEKCC